MEFFEFRLTLSMNSSVRTKVERSKADLVFLELLLSMDPLIAILECGDVTKTEF